MVGTSYSRKTSRIPSNAVGHNCRDRRPLVLASRYEKFGRLLCRGESANCAHVAIEQCSCSSELAQASLQRDDRFKKLEPLLTPPSSIERTSSSHTKVYEPGVNAKSVFAEPRPDPAHSASDPNPRDEEARAQIELALSQDPLNARALRMLGQLSEYGPNAGMRTEGLMRAAARNSLLEGEAIYWLMRKSYHSQDYSAALRYADILLRGYPQMLRPVAPVLGKIAEVPGASDQLKQLLATNPNWRSEFFRYFPDTITDARTPLDVLLSLRNSPVPPESNGITPLS